MANLPATITSGQVGETRPYRSSGSAEPPIDVEFREIPNVSKSSPGIFRSAPTDVRGGSEENRRSDIYYHTNSNKPSRSWKGSLSIFGIAIIVLIFLYWVLATKNGASNLWKKLSAVVAPTGKILSSKPMFVQGQSQLWYNAATNPGATSNGSGMNLGSVILGGLGAIPGNPFGGAANPLGSTQLPTTSF